MIEDTFSWPASSPLYSTRNGSPLPVRECASRLRMLALVSNDIGAYGLVASQVRSQERFCMSSRSRARASRKRIGRRVTAPSRSVGIAVGTMSPSTWGPEAR